MINGVGVGVEGLSAEATSRFKSRNMPNPLSNTPTNPITANISTPNRIRSVTRRCGTGSAFAFSSGVSTIGVEDNLSNESEDDSGGNRYHAARASKVFEPFLTRAAPLFRSTTGVAHR